MSIQDIAVLNNMVFFIFAMGVLTGAVCTGFFNFVKRVLESNVQYPRRVLTDEGYLYRFKGKYIPLELKDKLLLDHRTKVIERLNLKPHKTNKLLYIFIFALMVLLLFISMFTTGFFEALTAIR